MTDKDGVEVHLGDCVELWDTRTGQVEGIDRRSGKVLVCCDTLAQEYLWLSPTAVRIYGPPRPAWDKED